jgi:hypothetical protein
MMRKYLLVLLSMIIFIGCSEKKETSKPVALTNHSGKPIVLQSKYDTNAAAKEKKLLKKKIKKLDTVVNTQFDHLKDWVNNVGEAVDMME